jgi:hypothetical protein
LEMMLSKGTPFGYLDWIFRIMEPERLHIVPAISFVPLYPSGAANDVT